MASTSLSLSDSRAVTRDAFSASIGSICCCYTGQPLDTVKIRMQTNPARFNTVLSSSLWIARHEGIFAFWKGAVPTVMGMMADNAVAFSVNEGLKRAFAKPVDNNHHHISTTTTTPNFLQSLAIGAASGFFSAVMLLPSEIVKAKQQVVVGNVTAKEIVQRMVAKQGLSSLFIGLDAQIARDMPFYAVFFGGYEMNCYLLRTYGPSYVPDEFIHFVSGGLAGMGGWIVAMPFDVPKTNVQSRYDGVRVVGSFAPEFVRIARERGVTGLYTGLGPTLVRAFPANAALFVGVEMGKKFFDQVVWQK